MNIQVCTEQLCFIISKFLCNTFLHALLGMLGTIVDKKTTAPTKLWNLKFAGFRYATSTCTYVLTLHSQVLCLSIVFLYIGVIFLMMMKDTLPIIFRETNRHGSRRRDKEIITSYNWRDMDSKELIAFLACVLSMGNTVKKNYAWVF